MLFVGVIVFQIFIIKLVIILRKTGSNSELKQTFNDEYFVTNLLKINY